MGGITLEVFWTSIIHLIKLKDVQLKGESYLWMFPIYALATFIFLLIISLFGNLSLIVKGLIYMILFTFLEFISGITIKSLVRKSPWDYSKYKIKIFKKKYKSNLKGVICLQYLPIWFAYGILGELFFIFLMGI